MTSYHISPLSTELNSDTYYSKMNSPTTITTTQPLMPLPPKLPSTAQSSVLRAQALSSAATEHHLWQAPNGLGQGARVELGYHGETCARAGGYKLHITVIRDGEEVGTAGARTFVSCLPQTRIFLCVYMYRTICLLHALPRQS
jgi:hypothetical protein